MIFPFYQNQNKSYTIDDTNIWCERVIVSTCDNSHKYVSLCELLEDCPGVKQLTRPCIVNALNDLTTLNGYANTDPDKRFLRVTANGCLEVASPCVCDTGDRKVAASEWDTNPWPLTEKVKGSCSYDGLYCIDIEEAWPQTLVWRPSGPNGPFINPKMPSNTNCNSDCLNVQLCKVGGKWEVDYLCPEETPTSQYLLAIWMWGKTTAPCKRRTVRYFAKHRNSPWPIDAGTEDSSESYFDGDWIVKGTSAFAAPKSYGVFRIVEPGIYNISYSCYVTGNQTCNAIRAGIWNDAPGRPVEMWDFKYQWGEVHNPGSAYYNNPPFNRLWPDPWNKEKFSNNYTAYGWTMEQTGWSFGGSYNINVWKTGVEIYLAVKPDMRNIDPRIQQGADMNERYTMTLEGADGNAYGAATCIQVVKVAEVAPSYKLLEIKP